MDDSSERLILDTQKVYSESNRRKDRIIVLLVVLMFLEAAVGFGAFAWYESQFETVATEETTESVEVSTEGDNANAEYNAEYNEVHGDQYNDSATHNNGAQE